MELSTDISPFDFEALPQDMQNVILGFASPLDRLVFSLVARYHRRRYPYGQPIDDGVYSIRSGVLEGRLKDGIEPDPKSPPFHGEKLAVACAMEGQLARLETLVAKSRFTKRTVLAAAASGALNVLKFVDDIEFADRTLIVASVAAAHGQIKVLQWLRDEKAADLLKYPSLYGHALSYAQFDTVKWLKDIGLAPPENVLFHAVKQCPIPIIDWVRSELSPQAPFDYAVCESIGYLSRIDVLRHYNASTWPAASLNMVLNGAASTNDIDVFNWAKSVSLDFTSDDINDNLFEIAGENCSLDVLEFLLENRVPWNENAVMLAGLINRFNVLAWADSKGLVWDNDKTLIQAISCSSFDVVRYIIEVKKHPLPPDCVSAAFMQPFAVRHSAETVLNMVTYLHEHGCALIEDHLMMAAADNYLPVMEYMIAQGVPYDINDIAGVAYTRSHLAIYRWAVEKGAPLDPRVANAAIMKKDTDFLNFLEARDVEFTIAHLVFAAKTQPECAEWLFPRVGKWPEKFCTFVMSNQPSMLKTIKFAVENGAKLDESFYFACLESLSLEGVQYADKQGVPLRRLLDERDLVAQFELRRILCQRSRFYESLAMQFLLDRGVKVPSFKHLEDLVAPVDWNDVDLCQRFALDIARLSVTMREVNSFEIETAVFNIIHGTYGESGAEYAADICRDFFASSSISSAVFEVDIAGLPQIIYNPRHEHPLTLTNKPNWEEQQDGNYQCDSCLRTFTFYSYHCKDCRYDIHPGCQTH